MGWLFDAIRRWRFRRKRQLYSFFDGVRTRRIDPGRTWLSMLDDDSFNFETDTEDAVALEEPAYSAYLALICRHFGVERFDPQTERGLTDDELLSLADRFIAYVMAQKKSSSDSPTMPS